MSLIKRAKGKLMILHRSNSPRGLHPRSRMFALADCAVVTFVKLMNYSYKNPRLYAGLSQSSNEEIQSPRKRVQITVSLSDVLILMYRKK